jgi:hypothetical protein
VEYALAIAYSTLLIVFMLGVILLIHKGVPASPHWLQEPIDVHLRERHFRVRQQALLAHSPQLTASASPFPKAS